MPLDPAKDDKGAGPKGPSGPGSNVRRINPGGSSHTQFGSGATRGALVNIKLAGNGWSSPNVSYGTW